MTDKVRINDLAKVIREKTAIPLAESKDIVETIIQNMQEALLRGETIEIRGFGTFKVKTRKERWSRNIRLGTKVYVPERRSPSFTAGSVLKNRIKGK
jgi:nucleoid DNA-binding protein